MDVERLISENRQLKQECEVLRETIYNMKGYSANISAVIDAAKEFVNNHSNEAQSDFIRAVRKMESEEQS
jgi:cell division septum initiation protein DivIVA